MRSTFPCDCLLFCLRGYLHLSYRLRFTQACRAHEYPAKSGRGSAEKNLPSAAWEANAKNIQVAQVVELAKTGASNLQIRMDLVNKYLRPFVIEHLDS